jgi:hypothetical protein
VHPPGLSCWPHRGTSGAVSLGVAGGSGGAADPRVLLAREECDAEAGVVAGRLLAAAAAAAWAAMASIMAVACS